MDQTTFPDDAAFDREETDNQHLATAADREHGLRHNVLDDLIVVHDADGNSLPPGAEVALARREARQQIMEETMADLDTVAFSTAQLVGAMV